MSAPLVLVTGASGGIGRALAFEFARHGYDVALAARNADALADVAAKLAGKGAKTHIIPVDLAVPEGAKALLQALKDLHLEVEVLVNNAGFGDMDPVAEADCTKLVAMVDLNIRTLTELSCALLPNMVDRRRGGILNVASTAAYMPGPNMAVYYASKAYVLSLTEALYVELKDSGVHACALCPGPVKSGFQEASAMKGSLLLKVSPMMAPKKVARAGYRAFAKGKREIVPGLSNKIVAVMGRILPKSMTMALVKRLQTQ
ncbi:MAG: short-chain dehydrogenase [Robiginitomaculum sp.]|nr:MAG: short-chain dehydrogenase [Robiginitomaculum sp.]